MARRTYHTCQDAGDVYCPCDLGLSSLCLACPAMNGAGNCSDCAWSGACVLVQKEHHLNTTPRQRPEMVVDIAARVRIASQAFVLTVKVPRYFLDSLRSPGSFILIRPQPLPWRYNLPLTVASLSPQESTLDFYVQDVGVKSRALVNAGKEAIVRGPYRNGLVGISRLWQHPGARLLIVAKGIAQAVAMRLTECLIPRGYRVDVALGPGEIDVILGSEPLRALGAGVIEMPRSHDKNRQQITGLLSDRPYAALISAGSDQQHRGLRRLARSHLPDAAFIFTNNAVMSCAEGICGSCQQTVAKEPFRACKASDWSLAGEEG